MLRVRVGGLVFNGYAEDGFVLESKGFQGWDDGVDVRRETVVRPGAHGSFDVPGFLDSRVVSLSGWCYADSEAQLGFRRSQFTGIAADGGSVRLVVDHHGNTLWADARLTSKPTFDVDGGFPSARFQIQFWCANPRKFGDVRRHPDGSAWPFASGEAAFHYGNFPATPVFTVTAITAMSGYTIAGPAGKLVTSTVACNPGHPHTIDMATGLLVADGVVSVGSLSQADTWSIPAGAQVTNTLTPASGAGTLGVSVMDTYL